MQRREFVGKLGKVMTVAMFASGLGQGKLWAESLSHLEHSNKKNEDKRPRVSDFNKPILKAIALGINAPSPHNTQSWKFEILNETEMFFYIDENILLLATDPFTRQIHLGAGCFIETLVLGATSFGYEAKVKYFPKGYDSEKDFGSKPVARISLAKKDIQAHLLASHILKRQTNRMAYQGEIVTKQEFSSMEKLVGKSHAELTFVNEEKEMRTCSDIFYRGFEIESRIFRTNEETRHLFRFSEKERAEKRDGISIPQMGFKGLIKWFAENSLDNGDSEKWHSEKSIGQSLKTIAKGIESAKGIVIWKTPENNYLDWVKAGRDYVRFNLAATAKGFYLHPYNQAIQEYDEMKVVRSEMDSFMGIRNKEKIQMIVRIGRCSSPYYCYRRNVNDFLVS